VRAVLSVLFHPLGVIFLLIAAGYLFRRTPAGAIRAEKWSRALNRWVIQVALPALVLLKIHSLPDLSLSRPEIYLPVLQPWIQFFVALLAVTLLWRLAGWSRGTWACLVVTVGIGNTSFVGIPLLRALLDEQFLSTAILQDQLGSFLVLSVAAVPFLQIVAASSHGRKGADWSVLLRPLRFPAFIALLLSILFSSVAFPAWFESVLELLAGSLSPAALIAVGMMLRFSSLRRREIRNPLAVGVLLKLVVLPTLWIQIFPAWAERAGGIPALVLQTLLLEGAMASQIAGSVVVADQGFEPELSRLMVGMTILLSLVSVPIWAIVIS
jgi:predicted permease